MLFFLFYIIISLLLSKINSLKYFRAYSLISDEILFISNEGIKFFKPETQIYSLICDLDIIQESSDLEFVSFVQSLYDNGNYIFCRVKQYIFIISYNDKNLTQKLTLD